ncbi:C40 family peptidase [Candidatus Babeliales bacterium]|nr:C40 family peptidase [Candidatus Babeliales bacterium]
MMKISYVIMLFIVSVHTLCALPETMTISVPIANVRTKPERGDLLLKTVVYEEDDPGHKCQLLLGERVVVTDEVDNWYHVQLAEQKVYDQKKAQWVSDSGWIQKDQAVAVTEPIAAVHLVVCQQWASVFEEPRVQSREVIRLSLGSKLRGFKLNDFWWAVVLPNARVGMIQRSDVYQSTRVVSESVDQLRANIVASAKKFLGVPFCRYGRSAHDESMLTGMSCCGLVSLAYRANGLDIPFYVYDQCMSGMRINGDQLQPGDLIMFARFKERYNPCHVVMYVGNSMVAEVTWSRNPFPYRARLISAKERISLQPLKTIKDGQRLERFYVYFRSYLSSPDWAQRLRNASRKARFDYLSADYRQLSNLSAIYR